MASRFQSLKSPSIASGVPLRQSMISGSPVAGCTAGGAATARVRLSKVNTPTKRYFFADICFLLIIVFVVPHKDYVN
jgi:hypothetical protein